MQVFIHPVSALAVLPGVVLQVEDRWVPPTSLLEEVVGALHGLLVDVGNVDGLPLLGVHDITDDALRLPRRLLAPVGLGRLGRIWLGGRPSL